MGASAPINQSHRGEYVMEDQELKSMALGMHANFKKVGLVLTDAAQDASPIPKLCALYVLMAEILNFALSATPDAKDMDGSLEVTIAALHKFLTLVEKRPEQVIRMRMLAGLFAKVFGVKEYPQG